jgi:hypothetical protein
MLFEVYATPNIGGMVVGKTKLGVGHVRRLGEFPSAGVIVVSKCGE